MIQKVFGGRKGSIWKEQNKLISHIIVLKKCDFHKYLFYSSLNISCFKIHLQGHTHHISIGDETCKTTISNHWEKHQPLRIRRKYRTKQIAKTILYSLMNTSRVPDLYKRRVECGLCSNSLQTFALTVLFFFESGLWYDFIDDSPPRWLFANSL